MNPEDLTKEKERLSYTIDCMEEEYRDLDSRLSSGIEAADPATVEAMTNQFIRRLKVIDLVRNKPYFARIDFTPEGGKTDHLYIGKTTLINSSTDVLVVDWRAPVASLYYDGRTGDAEYSCLDGNIKGQLHLKRQFQIEDRTLLGYSDIDVTFDEELLRPYLEVGSDTRLKNIIATIQSEQNRIIRADLYRPLIVQGVAGSGKTTVALHRIAYLIYTYAQKFKPEEFLIIAPNALFLDYISNVLPDLGVEDVRQQTFEALAQTVLGKKLKIQDTGEKLAGMLTLTEDRQSAAIKASRYKSSLEFRDAIDRYLSSREESFVPEAHFCAGKFVLCSVSDIRRMFLNEYHGEPYSRRVTFIKERLESVAETKRNAVLAKIDEDRNRKIAALRAGEPDAETFRKKKQAIYSEYEETVRDLMSSGKKMIKDYMKKWSLPTAGQLYASFIADRQALGEFCSGVDEETLDTIVSGASALRKAAEYEDLAPQMHIQYRIKGLDKKLSARHAVIDEAQDFSEFQFFVLTEVLGCGSFTILGDLAQGIYWYRGTSDWQRCISRVFSGECSLLTLEKSYRSTVEIMEQANIILSKMRDVEGIKEAEPVIRHGERVRYQSMRDEKELLESAEKRIAELKANGMENIALICKSASSCELFHHKLKAALPGLHILSGKEDSYSGGVSLVPSYLVKGLEFDAVILLDAHEYRIDDLFDIKLLYVAMTRAMHTMDIFYYGEKPELFCEEQ